MKDFREKAEESDLLRESLSRTKDELNQEKRLNTAIKQKKVRHIGLEKKLAIRERSFTRAEFRLIQLAIRWQKLSFFAAAIFKAIYN